MMTRLDAELLVVGAGRAGAPAARRQPCHGRDVLVLERAAHPREKPCAEFLSLGVVDVLDRLGVLDTVHATDAAWPLGMRICAARRDFPLSYAEPAAGAAPTRSQPARRTAHGIPRPVLDRLLRDHTQAAGARVRERVRVLEALTESGRIVGVRALGPGGEARLRARCVVAADGAHSAVTRSLGLNLPARWPRWLGLVACYRGAAGIGEFGETHVGPGLYCGLAPVGDGLVSAGMVGVLRGRMPGESAERLFECRLAELPGSARALGDARRVTPVRGVGPLARRVRRVAGPGFLLVGDAAGFLAPFTGEGAYRALWGAELAADVVEQALWRAGAHPRGGAGRRATASGRAPAKRAWQLSTGQAGTPPRISLVAPETVTGNARRSAGAGGGKGKRVHTENSVIIQADLSTIYTLAAAVERWPQPLPHYRRVRVLREDGTRRLVETAAQRDRIPVRWWAEQACFPDVPRTTFRHVHGVTTGMAVAWSFMPGPDGVRVSIRHDLRLRWPLIGGPVADHIVGSFFDANIAGKTLWRIKALAEGDRPAVVGRDGDAGSRH